MKLLGGVTGRPELRPPYWNLRLSAGFRIWNEHINVSSTDIIAPPFVSLSGSDHSRSHSRPWSGTSVGRMMRRICSIDCRSGLRPPWQQKIFSSTIAATGRQLKQSVNVFHILML
uniref:Uncharacterized protein n=1 Tax=Anopheles merus TaxID=30066 RepID=A0A182UTS2_ANOME